MVAFSLHVSLPLRLRHEKFPFSGVILALNFCDQKIQIPTMTETQRDAPPIIVEPPPSPALLSALASARDYATASRSEATWRAYQHDWERFASWCASVGQSALPASTTTICAFLATEADAGLAVATLARRLAAIRVVHQGNQQTSSHDAPAVREVMRGIRNRQKGRPSPKKAPLIDTDLTLLVDTLDSTTLAGARDRALLLIGLPPHYGALNSLASMSSTLPSGRKA